MKTIPTELTGDAKQFIGLDLYKLAMKEYSCGCDESPFLNTQEFFNQPFEPAMIEYFEGWENKHGIAVFEDLISIGFYPEEGFMEINGETILRKLEWTLPMPKTLNDFVTATKNSGINLQWRK